MLRGEFASAGEQTSEELRAAYDELLAETIEEVGIEQVAAESGVDEGRLSALVEGDSPRLTLAEAAEILAADESRPDAATLASEAREILLMGMSIAVLDVEALASGIDDELEPKEIQQKAEGRQPLPLDEYALLHSYIESRK